MIKKILSQSPLYRFCVYSNQYHPVKELIEEKDVAYDHNVHDYEAVVQAYLAKRRTKKSEIAAKIYIQDAIPEITDSLQQQRLVKMTQLTDLQTMEKSYKSKNTNTQYIISKFTEDHFKPMIDEYLNKVLISGREVSMEQYETYKEGKNKIDNMYNTFFDGEQQSGFEIEIEQRYLAQKQHKYFQYTLKRKPVNKCVWTFSQQRRIEKMKNWRARDFNEYDDNFYPIYEDLDINEIKKQRQQLIMSLNQDNWWTKFVFNLYEARFYGQTRRRVNWITSQIINRVVLYCNCLEFTRLLQIPPDFHIEHSIVNVHIWLILERLKEIHTNEAKVYFQDVELQFKEYTLEKVNSIHLKKKQDFIKDVNFFMNNNRKLLHQHFQKSENPAYKIDALVWSVVFFEKVDRYSDQVYLMSSYILQNYKYISTLPITAFENANLKFDVLKIPFDFKEKLIELNPQLSKAEFQDEFDTDKKKKKYYYNYDENFEMPMQQEQKEQISDTIVDDAGRKVFHTVRKFQTLDTYDYYNKKEEDQKKEKEYESKYFFKSEQKQKLEQESEDYVKAKRMQRKKQNQ